MDIIISQDQKLTLIKLDPRAVPDVKNEVRIFIGVRNELTKLPFLLSYYRNLGATRFFVIDDRSNDGTGDYLLTQNDCHVFRPSNTFLESRAGVDWQNLLLDTYGEGHWTLVADADELLVYPHCESIKLPQFCTHLDREGSTHFFAFLLDMYPAGSLSDAGIVAGKSFIEICPYFDKDYLIQAKSAVKGGENIIPLMRVTGGPRVRKFYPLQKRIGFFSRAFVTATVRIANRMKFWKGDKPHFAPALIKAPLVKWRKGYKRLSNHLVLADEASQLSKVTGAFLHFKFFADFHDKAKRELERGEHFGGSQEYQRYLRYIRKNPEVDFMYSGSRKYEGSQSLIMEGLIQTSKEFESYSDNLPGKTIA